MSNKLKQPQEHRPIIIVGAGVIGLTIAFYLTKLKNCPEITIFAREMPRLASSPGDEWVEGQWASPWAGAIFAADENPEDEVTHSIEQESYRYFWKIAHEDPASGVELRMIRQYYDETSVPDPASMKIHLFTQKYRQLRNHELPVPRRGITGGIEYMSMCINPWVYLPWLRSKLEGTGKVRFIQCHLESLQSAATHSTFGSSKASPIIINASGLGAGTLTDVRDSAVHSVRGQTMWVQCDYSGAMAIRSGREYTYFIPRAFSQGAIFGGISQPDNDSKEVDESLKENILERIRDLVPDAYKAALTVGNQTVPKTIKRTSSFQGVGILKDIVGFRPARKGGQRIELDEKSGETPVIHAYGFEGHGYISSGGTAKLVLDLIEKLHPIKSHL
ncbi:D-amino acid oxidase (predicted) [Sugiyamaella lignohabitans]|uniref:D-amino acid oxidase (Predicted) n=1 Tax=Sugiyamaella lignohabitans TaxID=796027 RepID=A0A161HMQ0_9ASCO|nr:D-amino acid oxidase (predicted) [Sugiyamaella lignohabitans]ANB15127.1 D-amino acid oxidase (predicted) [Sugiyamaella lignohabitans]